MSIQSEIDRLNSAKTAISNAIEGRGVAVPEGTALDGMAELITKIPTFYTYKGTFTVDGWTLASSTSTQAAPEISTGSTYSQTATIEAVDGGPAMSSDLFLTAPYTERTNIVATNETLASALGLVNTAILTPGDGTITLSGLTEKPSCDIPVYWFGREI